MNRAPSALSLEALLEQRSRRLRWLVLGLSAACLLGLAAYMDHGLVPPHPYGLARDYRVFYAAARLLAVHSNPYRLAVLQSAEQAFDRYPSLRPTSDSFAYLPVVALVLVPLSRLSFWTSYAIFTCFGAVAAMLTIVLLARDLGWTHIVPLVLGVAISWVAVLGFMDGQFNAFLLAALAGSMLLAWHDRPLASGLLLGLVWIKPDLLWPAPIFLFLALWPRPRRALWFALGFAVTTVLGLAASAMWMPEWWRSVHQFAAGVGHFQLDLAGLPGLLAAAPAKWGLGVGLLAPGSLVIVAAALAAMGVFGVWMAGSPEWRQVSPVARIAWGVGLPVGIWLAAAPYSHPNDDLLLLPLFMLTVGRDARRVHGLGLGLALLVVAWLLLIWPSFLVPWLVGLGCLGLLAVALWRWRTNPRFTGFGAGLCLLTMVLLPPIWAFQVIQLGLAPIAVLIVVVEGARTCWMEIRGGGSGPAYVTESGPGLRVGPSPSGG